MATPRNDEAVPLGADLVIPLLALAFSIYFFDSIRDLVWEAKANGIFIGTALVALIALQLVRIALAVLRGRARLGTDALWQPRDALGKRVAMVVVTILFIATIEWMGLTLGLLLGMLASLWAMGVRKPTVLIAISVLVAASAYVLFIATLDSAFPHGPIENLIAAVSKRA
ncbi:MAG: hypothetical protein WA210_14100 [Burkholderiaceae bacterium]